METTPLTSARLSVDVSLDRRPAAFSQGTPQRRLHPAKRPLGEAIGSYLADCHARNLSPRTMEQYEWALRSFRTSLAAADPVLAQASADNVRRWIETLRATRRPASVRSAVRALKVFTRWLYTNGLTSSDPLEHVRLPRAPVPLIVPLDGAQVAALMSAGPPILRVALAILADTGLRASELCGLTVDDFRQDFLRVRGKGGHERLVPYGAAVAAELERYVRRGRRRPLLHFDEPFLLLPSGVPLTPHRLGELMRETGAKCGIRGVRVSPHTLRHTFAIEFLRNGGGELALQKVLGHSSLDMVRIYAEMTETDIAAAHAGASPLDRWRARGSKSVQRGKPRSPTRSSRRSSGESSDW